MYTIKPTGYVCVYLKIFGAALKPLQIECPNKRSDGYSSSDLNPGWHQWLDT